MGLLRTASQVPICNSRTPTQCLLLSSRIIGKTRLRVMMQREHIIKNCRGARSTTCPQVYLQANKWLKKVTDDLKALVLSLTARVETLEGGKPSAKVAPAPAADDDDDVDLFGSDEEEDDEEKKRITEERLKAYNEKKAKKPKVIAKTSVLFDVKPWDDETDMDAMKKACVSIEMDGLLWGAS